VQDTQAFYWADREIAAELERIMEAAFAGALAMAERKRVDLRGAAMMVAVGRVAEATALRGLYP
jgi:glutamate dehydrogenase (NAD(P)+)